MMQAYCPCKSAHKAFGKAEKGFPPGSPGRKKACHVSRSQKTGVELLPMSFDKENQARGLCRNMAISPWQRGPRV